MPCWAEVDVADPEAVMGFYGAVLGWTFDAGPRAPHHHAVASSNGRAVAGIGSPGVAAPPAWTLYFAAEDADDVAAAVDEYGGEVLHGPEDVADGRLLVALDGGGAIFGVWESDAPPSPPAWVEAASAEPGATRTFYARLFDYAYGAPSDEVPGYVAIEDVRGGVGLAGDALPHWLVHFAVPDAAAALDAARAAGGAVVEEVTEGPWGRRAVLTDPGGARFGVVET